MKRHNRVKRRNMKKIYRRRRILLSFIGLLTILFIGSTTIKVAAALKPTYVSDASRNAINNMIIVNPLMESIDRTIEEEKEKEKMEELEKLREEMRAKKAAEEQERLAREKEELKTKKIAYLTFDDGPSAKVTPRILETLKQENVKATFFVVGKMADANPQMLKRVHDEGHAIGHHSYSHDYKYIYANTNNFIGELNKTGEAFKRAIGDDFESKLLRFPGGSFEKKKQKFVKATGDLGYKNYDWNALNGDAEGHNLSKDTLIRRTRETVGSKREVIILMHDTDAKKTTADALPQIIKDLKSQGYEFRTLDQK